MYPIYTLRADLAKGMATPPGSLATILLTFPSIYIYANSPARNWTRVASRYVSLYKKVNHTARTGIFGVPSISTPLGPSSISKRTLSLSKYIPMHEQIFSAHTHAWSCHGMIYPAIQESLQRCTSWRHPTRIKIYTYVHSTHAASKEELSVLGAGGQNELIPARPKKRRLVFEPNRRACNPVPVPSWRARIGRAGASRHVRNRAWAPHSSQPHRFPHLPPTPEPTPPL
jgi:hypothetical protein